MALRRTAAILIPSVTFALSLMFAVSPATLRAQDVKTIWDGVYADEQATRGQQLYATNCAGCHKPDLSGNEDGGTGAPSLRGARFMQTWEGSSLSGLVSKVRETMPRNNAGGLPDDVYMDIISFILKTNRFPAGKDKLALVPAVLDKVVIIPNEKDRKTVWDGVYTPEQAARGDEVFQTRCATCHNKDFTGGMNAPALKGDRFWQTWELSNLTSITSKIRDTMPRNNAGSLDDESYMAIVARILQVNGFPAGKKELKWITDDLTPVQIVKALAERQSGISQIQNFALVQVVGCLAAGPKTGWMLTKATDPVVTQTEEPTPVSLKAAESKPPGSGTFNLVSAAQWNAKDNVGRRVEARGTLRRLPNDVTISITSLTPIPGTCN